MVKKNSLLSNNNYLNVHSIESFSTVDGPGIRYVIFLQGCSFRCKYCHNIDTWNKKAGKKMKTNILLKEIQNNIEYLKPNSGGVTVSGGEPLEQADKLINFFSDIHNIELTTCVDTAGYKFNDHVKLLLKETDLVLLDLKHPDSIIHKKLTGYDNSIVFAFQDYLDENQISYWVRYTLIKGFNDDTQTLHKLKKRLINRKSLKKIDVLPYHTMGIEKWKKLAKSYSFKEYKPVKLEYAEKIQNFLVKNLTIK